MPIFLNNKNLEETERLSSGYDCLLKILIVGESGVGKTAILERYCDGSFNESFISTIGVDFKFTNLKVNDKDVRLQIWDSAGQERFRVITQSFYRNSQGVVLVYDCGNKESFTTLTYWLEQIQRYAPDTVIALLGNKCDLDATEKEVSTQEGKNFAESRGLSFFETSAKTNKNIDQAFADIAERGLAKMSNSLYQNNKLNLGVQNNKAWTGYGCC